MSAKTPVIHHFPAHQPSTNPPLLFVHGGYSSAALWGVRFIPYFQAQGYDCYALELSGHGSHPADRAHLDDFGIDDYVADLAAAVASLPAAPVLIAHSMGCLVSQRFLEQGTARAVAFLAPVPPTGTGGTASRFALTMPDFFAELPNAVNGTASEKTMRTMARVYFSPSMALKESIKYLPLIQPESEKAVAEMVTAPFRIARGRARIPALVMGGSADQVFPASMLYFTAASWNAKTQVIAGAGHMLMLDPQWADAAGKLQAWVENLA
ncbi:MAG: alpha/beta hydrolase [Betaproteobacteria bacterium HGW-Betaproteobacteria-7]|jgi:pimeloyl-ACP methyl ester carboxylesterase|nr:MAG: alpha/beta hydrolase [Betaproteobacteria bacterium HGW-Betaproteobacteria-7]